MSTIGELVDSVKTVKDTYEVLRDKDGVVLEEELRKVLEISQKRVVDSAKDLSAVFIFDKALSETLVNIVGEEVSGIFGILRKASIATNAVTFGISAVNWVVAKYKLSSIKREKEFVQNCLRIAKEKGYLS